MIKYFSPESTANPGLKKRWTSTDVRTNVWSCSFQSFSVIPAGIHACHPCVSNVACSLNQVALSLPWQSGQTCRTVHSAYARVHLESSHLPAWWSPRCRRTGCCRKPVERTNRQFILHYWITQPFIEYLVVYWGALSFSPLGGHFISGATWEQSTLVFAVLDLIALN